MYKYLAVKNTDLTVYYSIYISEKKSNENISFENK